jgi:predicted Zn-dependent protease
MELWGDVLRDVDGVGAHVTRVSDAEEMQLGMTLAANTRTTWLESPVDMERVEKVGRALTPHVRRHGVSYTFHLVDNARHNAWAAPGGHIYVTTGLLTFVQSDAELAAVLGHEIGHVDDRHCIERYQYALRLKKVGAGDVGSLVDFMREIPRIGYSKYEELEADATGLRLMSEAGYPPEAAPAVLERLASANGETAATRAPNAVVEAGQAAVGAIGSYGASHPDATERARRLRDRIRR